MVGKENQQAFFNFSGLTYSMLGTRDIEDNKKQSENSHSVEEKLKLNNDKTLCSCNSHHTRL